MLAEGNLQQNKGLTQHRVVSFPLTNEFYYQMLWKKKKKCLPAVALLCFPRTNNGKAVEVFLFFTFVCVCVCVSQQQQQQERKPQSFVSLRNIYFFFQKVI